MANVSLCTVCVILSVLYKPEALCLNIDRSLCLETIIKFMHGQHKCGFYYPYADALLKDYNVSCQTECQVTLNAKYLYNNCLEKVKLGFGNEIYEREPCRGTYNCHALNMNITCLAWNKVKVPIGGYCKHNEQCHGSENSGVCEQNRCVCKTGYILSNFECHEGNLSLNQLCSFNEQCAGSPYVSCLGGICSCIKGYTAEESNYCVPVKVPVGEYCTLNEQCQGSEHSGVCDHEKCVCRSGYIQHDLICHEGNLALNNSCSLSEQCSGPPYASCLGGICSCIEGYTAEESTYCVQIKAPVGGYCKQNEHCQESKSSGVCEQNRCVCKIGYILSNFGCHEGNLSLNQSCSFSEQCSRSPYVSCLERKCSCIEGYTAEESNYCVPVKVQVAGYCTLNEQCQGSEHSGVCDHEKCVCRSGYIQHDLICHEGNLALNKSCSLSEQCSGSPYASCLGGICSCIEGYTAEESTYCVQIKAPVGGYCKQNEHCQESKSSGVCVHNRCVCKTGYILSNLECNEGNLTLNQPCSFTEQCSGSPYASCLGEICSCIVGYTAENSTDCVQTTLALNQSCTLSNQCAGSPYASCFGGKCTCIEGYTAENSTKCVQSQEITVSSSLQHHQEKAGIGTTLGVLFGGLLLGVILTTVAVAIIYRRSKTHVNKREGPKVTFADNNRYSLAKIVDHGTFQNIQTKDKKREVSPYACSEETWIYDNVYSKPRNRQTQEAVYNHLHEQVKQEDDDYYDHACPASAHIGDMEDYSRVQHTTS